MRKSTLRKIKEQGTPSCKLFEGGTSKQEDKHPKTEVYKWKEPTCRGTGGIG